MKAPTPQGALPGLDERITDTFSVLGLVIAVVAGYLAGVWPVISQILNQPRPSANDDAEELAVRCTSYERICWVLTSATILVLLVLTPIVIDVLRTFDWSASVSPVRASVLLFALLMIGSVVCAVLLGVRLRGRAAQLRRK